MVDKLRSVGDRARRMSRATACRVQDVLLAQRDRARGAGFETTCKLSWVCALELALEKPVQFLIPWRFLAVRHADRVRLPYQNVSLTL